MTDAEFQRQMNRAAIYAYSLIDLADYLGVGRLTLERWMSGQNLPYDSLREPICEAVKKWLDR